MKKIRFLILSVLVMVAMALSACAGNGTPTAKVQSDNGTPAGQAAENSDQGLEATQQGAVPADGSSDEDGTDAGDATPDASTATISGAYTVDGQSVSENGKSYDSSSTDQSAVLVTNGGELDLTNATITGSGNSSSTDNSSLFGQNAGVLAQNGSVINITDSKVTTTGVGANGVFASGEDSHVTLDNVSVNCNGQYAHAAMATLGGSLTLNNVSMNTGGDDSAAIAADHDGDTIQVKGGKAMTTGKDSPGIYSAGDISVEDGDISSTNAEAVVIEGSHSVDLTDTALTAGGGAKWGVMIYQGNTTDTENAANDGNLDDQDNTDGIDDTEVAEGDFSMSGGSLTYASTSGPLFYVTNGTGFISLSGVTITTNSGVLINAAAGDYGNKGANGGDVEFTVDSQTLSGDVNADALSTINMTLQSSSQWSGAINNANTAKEADLSMDASSTWNVTGDSYLTILDDSEAISGSTITNIVGNGHTVYYDPDSNDYLQGMTYPLSGGGSLVPLG